MSGSLPALSIVIPMHNSAEWIAETLHSILKAAFPFGERELILVDDSSQDEGAQVASRLLRDSGAIPNWRVIKAEVRSPAGARNLGWRAARAEWIQFFDSDDLMHPDKFLWQFPLTESAKPEIAVFFSDFQHYELADGHWQPAVHHSYGGDPADPLTDLITVNFFIHLNASLIRRSWLERVSGFDESFLTIEDVNLWLRMVMAGAALRYAPTPEPVFLYRAHESSISRRERDSFVQCCTRNARLVENKLRETNGLTPERLGRIAEVYYQGTRFTAGRQRWSEFNELADRLDNLDGRFIPARPAQVRMLSQALGYRRAERLIVQARKLRSWLVR